MRDLIVYRLIDRANPEVLGNPFLTTPNYIWYSERNKVGLAIPYGERSDFLKKLLSREFRCLVFTRGERESRLSVDNGIIISIDPKAEQANHMMIKCLVDLIWHSEKIHVYKARDRNESDARVTVFSTEKPNTSYEISRTVFVEE